MSHYTHLLLATDFSPEGSHVASRALQLANNQGAKLSIVHVLEFTPIVYGGGEFAMPLDTNIEADLEAEARKELDNQASTLHIAPESRHLLIGSTKEEIAKLVREVGADLLVVGGHNVHGLKLLFGTTANAILHAMPCDVLAVRLDENGIGS